jgi:hypothetical protein
MSVRLRPRGPFCMPLPRKLNRERARLSDVLYRIYKIASGLCIRCSKIREPYRRDNTTCRSCAVRMSRYDKERANATNKARSRRIQ